MLHMIGDTYSAAHVQRSPPVGSEGNCDTSKIEWHFSMDLVSWKQHTPADGEYRDWRYRCVVRHTADLMALWVEARQAVSRVNDPVAKIELTNLAVRQTMGLLCRAVLREDRDVLARPAGGAAAGYSSASGTDNWKVFTAKPEDKAIQPVGPTSVAEAEAFYKRVADELENNGSVAQFFYPSRGMRDLCNGISKAGILPAPLRCTPQEIDWAMRGSDAVKNMWLPARDLH